jgi:hypothetical protein
LELLTHVKLTVLVVGITGSKHSYAVNSGARTAADSTTSIRMLLLSHKLI